MNINLSSSENTTLGGEFESEKGVGVIKRKN